MKNLKTKSAVRIIGDSTLQISPTLFLSLTLTLSKPLLNPEQFSGGMPGVTSESGELNSLSIVPHSLETQTPRVYPLRTHRVAPPFGRISISWARGNTLRVSLLQSGGAESGGEVVDVKLNNAEGGEIPEAQRRRIAYGSVTPFALLQSRKNQIDELHYDKNWYGFKCSLFACFLYYCFCIEVMLI